MPHEEFSKYEIARILGARALQIAMNAPLLMKINEEKLEDIMYDPLRIAEIEFESNVLPITVNRPFPDKVEEELKKEKVESKEKDKIKKEEEEEKEIRDSGEIMELAKSDEEIDREERAKDENQGM